jgi:3-hydroxyphenylacetate 6-hydroxylase
MSNTQLWAIAVLAKDSEVQEKAYKSFLRRKTFDERHDFEHDKEDYLSAFIKEINRYYATLRIPPPRRTTKDLVWRGHFIPEGTTVMLNAHGINRGKYSSCLALDLHVV